MTWDFELPYREKYPGLCGIDEAGRGPLCGPVVAGAVILPDGFDVSVLNDSKKLSEVKREELYEEITSRCLWGVGIAEPEEIDAYNILNATYLAMCRAVDALQKQLSAVLADGSQQSRGDLSGVPADGSKQNLFGVLSDGLQQNFSFAFTKERQQYPSFALVDGNRIPKGLTVPAEAVVKGDAKCPSISAASVLAKVTRDRMMKQLALQYPQYELEKHKGYPTKEHYRKILQHGVAPIYRKSFLKNLDQHRED